jgi:hypothetical protein
VGKHRVFAAIIGLVVVVGGLWVGYHFVHASTASAFRNAKASAISRSLARAASATHSASDHGGQSVQPSAPAPSRVQLQITPGPIPLMVSSSWQAGWYPGTQDPVLVVSGTEQADAQKGVIWVYVLNDETVPWNGEFVAPIATRAITITGITGTTVSWRSSNGQSGSFDLRSRTWSITSGS